MHFLDMVHKNKNLDISAIEKIWVEMRQEIKKTGHRMPLVDTDFSLTLIPMKRFFLGVCYTEKNRMVRRLV